LMRQVAQVRVLHHPPTKMITMQATYRLVVAHWKWSEPKFNDEAAILRLRKNYPLQREKLEAEARKRLAAGDRFSVLEHRRLVHLLRGRFDKFILALEAEPNAEVWLTAADRAWTALSPEFLGTGEKPGS
jgi:hypothetical protein